MLRDLMKTSKPASSTATPAVVILSAADYVKITKPRKSLYSALRACLSGMDDIVPPRSREIVRGVKL